jgi:hypothetical protein
MVMILLHVLVLANETVPLCAVVIIFVKTFFPFPSLKFVSMWYIQTEFRIYTEQNILALLSTKFRIKKLKLNLKKHDLQKVYFWYIII